MRLATASGRRSQQPPDQTSAYRCGRSRLRRLGQPYQPSPRPEFFNGIGQEGTGPRLRSGPLCAQVSHRHRLGHFRKADIPVSCARSRLRHDRISRACANADIPAQR